MDGLSAIIIARNEAHNIARCIGSLQGVVDEVVVVDAESTDGTQAIAEQLGARVVIRAWTGYSDQKNFANGLARQPWILSMDADEALSPELKASITRTRQARMDGAYRFNRLTNYCGTWIRHGGWYPDAKVRLFPKDGSRWEGEHVHEVLVLDPSLTVHHLSGDLLHWSYHTLEDHRQRIERYSDLHARKMKAAGRQAGPLERWLSPVAKFVQGYLLQGGFLDGIAGFHIARLSARAVHLKYTKLQRMQHA
jgi:glycosyltransferase involved in cell wall biosynthesis